MYGISDVDQLSDEEVVALTLDGEAEGEGFLGQQAVCNVIMRRAALSWKRDETPRLVCLHHAQFSCWNDGNPDRARIMAIKRDGTDIHYRQCLSIARAGLAGNLRDVTCGADSYEVTGTGAYWTRGLKPVAVIGKHSFFVTRAVLSQPAPSSS